MAEVLLADVGASHTRLARGTGQGLSPGTTRRYANAGFAGLGPLMAAYLDGTPVDAVCAGVAGPVRAGTAQLTNLDWFIDAAEIARATGAKAVHLLNDLQAQAHALDDLPPARITPLVPGVPDPDGPRMVMGLGTGSNIAVAHRVGDRLFVPPAEAGHSGLPHMGAAENDLIAALGREVAHKPYEAVLSGPGLARLHRLCSGQEQAPDRIIALYETGVPEARETLDLFGRILGTVMGNLALTHMSTGGVFLIGGLARAIAPHFNELGFHRHFCDKGPYTQIMRDMPISLVTDDHAALLGCLQHLRAILK
ncbi:Glucokinase [Roseovarius tolerans]|uniref:Glucokinase n=1 Tax=Roseovarius tolerans TaxID=74031 RepID=A0A0L6CTX3_9RHOB|nr:glucokinase [Roseovarius tolerans]KNX41130.1 Glucokinase [Roseovarius tolerans]